MEGEGIHMLHQDPRVLTSSSQFCSIHWRQLHNWPCGLKRTLWADLHEFDTIYSRIRFTK